jgi:hypothetical protein
VTKDSEKPPVERALELFVYAPLGVALFARDTVPGFLKMFVARGRSELGHRQRMVGQQVNQARTIGQFAVTYGAPELRRRVEGGLSTARARAEETLGGLVVRHEPATETAAPAEPVPDAPPPASRPAPSGNGHAARPVGPAVATLAIPDYDELSASQVVERLAGLGAEELEAVRQYELAHRGRRTILGKIAQLTP